MHMSNNSGMVLVTMLLAENNFLNGVDPLEGPWLQGINLDFINVGLPQPADEPKRGKWKRVDEVVSS